MQIEKAKQTCPDRKHKTRRQYHTLTQGYIQNEIFRRLDPKRRTMGKVLRREIAEPLGAQIHLGLNEEEIGRVAKLKVMYSIAGVIREYGMLILFMLF